VIPEELHQADHTTKVAARELILFLHPAGESFRVSCLPLVLLEVCDVLTPFSLDGRNDVDVA